MLGQRNRNYLKRSQKRKSRMGFPWRKLLLVLFAAAFTYLSVRLIVYEIHSANNAKTNAELNTLYAEQTEEPESAEGAEILPETLPEETLMEAFEESDETLSDKAVEATSEPVQPELLKKYQYIGSEIASSANKLYAINPDLVAWLDIPDVARLPVVYRDNVFYLTHDFYGKESDAGTLFLDQYHPLKAQNQYLMIHGHNMYDASMFGKLTHYRKKDFIATHPTLTLTTLYSKDTYEIIGSLYVEEGDMVSIAGLGRPRFASVEDFNRFIQTFKARAMHFTDAEITPDTALLALATCYETGRIVVLFRRTSAIPISPN